jgi:hypothetical protein
MYQQSVTNTNKLHICRMYGRTQEVSGSDLVVCVDESSGKTVKETATNVGKLGTAGRGAFGNAKEVFNPPKSFANAHVNSLDQYKEMYKQSIEDPNAFWTKIAQVRNPSQAENH